MRAGHGLAARVRSASLAPVAIASRLGMSLAGFPSLGCRLQGFPPCPCALRAARCALRAVLGTADEHHSAWLQRAHSRMCLRAVGAAPTSLHRTHWRVRVAGVCAARGESVACRHITAVPCPATPLPLPPLRLRLLPSPLLRAQSCGLNVAGGGKGHGLGWRCATQPPPAAATRTEGGSVP